MRSLAIGLASLFLVLALYSLGIAALVEALGIQGEVSIYLLNKGLFAALLLLLVLKLGHQRQIGLNCRARISTLPLFWPLLAIVLMIAARPSQAVSDPLSLFILLLIALAVGFAEEVLFRGYVIHWARHSSVRMQILVSGIAFGAVHLLGLGKGIPTAVILSQVYFAAALGLIFACARLRDGSLCLPILVHGLFDFFSFWASGGISSTFEHPEQVIPGMLIAGTVALLWAAVLIYRAPAYARDPGQQRKGSKASRE